MNIKYRLTLARGISTYDKVDCVNVYSRPERCIVDCRGIHSGLHLVVGAMCDLVACRPSDASSHHLFDHSARRHRRPSDAWEDDHSRMMPPLGDAGTLHDRRPRRHVDFPRVRRLSGGRLQDPVHETNNFG